MASFDVAFSFLMESEDPQHACKIVPDIPPGAHAISGINSAKFPQDFVRIGDAAQSERLALVETFYKTHFWSHWFDALTSDEIAKRVFDACVNMGPVTGIDILQTALWPSRDTDGLLGPETVDAANSANPETLVEAFKDARENYYRRIVARNPADAKYLTGWLARAGK